MSRVIPVSSSAKAGDPILNIAFKLDAPPARGVTNFGSGHDEFQLAA
jgi:hypothetical protein